MVGFFTLNISRNGLPIRKLSIKLVATGVYYRLPTLKCKKPFFQEHNALLFINSNEVGCGARKSFNTIEKSYNARFLYED